MNPPSNSISARGSWAQIGAPAWICHGMEVGFHLNLENQLSVLAMKEYVQKGKVPRNTIVLANAQEAQQKVDDEVQRLLEMKAIVPSERHEIQALSPLLVIPKKDKKKLRVCVDLRRVNKALTTPFKFKMEGIDTVMDMLPRDAFMVSVDLKDGYLQVPMDQQTQRLLGFSWRGQLYRYCRLPFGVSWAPWLFTKIVKVVMKHLRRHGIQGVAYIDDFLLWHPDPEILRQHLRFLLDTLASVGWSIATEKCVLEPTQKIQFLGWIIDTVKATITATPKRIKSLKKSINRLVGWRTARLRDLASVVGKVVSMARAAPMASTLIQHLQQALRRAKPVKSTWDTWVCINHRMRQELDQLLSSIDQWNGASFWRPSSSIVFQTDASESGWGACLPQTGAVACGEWSSEESAVHSNIRELRAIGHGLSAFQEELRCRRILLESDNITALAYTRKVTGRSDALFEAACEVRTIAVKLRVQIAGRHIKGETNVVADLLSRGQTNAEWSLSPEWWRAIVNRWGLPDIDRFASTDNTKTHRFCSRGPQAGCEQPDAFIGSWAGCLNYVNPPLPLIGRALQHLRESKARAVFVLPVWEAQPWWPLAMAMTVGPVIEIPDPKTLVDIESSTSRTPEILRNQQWSFRIALLDGNSTMRQ